MSEIKKVGNIQKHSKDIIKILNELDIVGCECFYGFSDINREKLRSIFKESFNPSDYLDDMDRGGLIGGKIIGDVEPHDDFSNTVCAFFFDKSKTRLKFVVGDSSVEVESGRVYLFDARVKHCVVNCSFDNTVQPFWFIAESDSYG